MQLNEVEETALIHPDLEHLNEIAKFRDPEPEQLNEICLRSGKLFRWILDRRSWMTVVLKGKL